MNDALSTAAVPLLEVYDLVKHYPVRRGVLGRVTGWVRAVDGISFTVGYGETLSLVGESGCGKTTAARSLLRLIEPTAGRVLYRPAPHADPVDVTALSPSALRPWRRDLQIVFQDPFESLNPRLSISQIVGEPLVVHRLARGVEVEERVVELLRRVGLDADARHRFPHEFSGGQRQRIGIARALASRPKLIVCDEAVSALDVSIQAQVINLLRDLQEEYGLSFLFIAHDLSVVKYVSDRVAVMYLGRIVESGRTEEIFTSPAHPYTQALLSAVPRPDPHRCGERIVLEGELPSPAAPPSGCHFRTRCPQASEECAAAWPAAVEVAPGHRAACLRAH